MSILKSFLYILKDYCMNSSLAGLNYIADSRYHFTERLFWFACLILSSFSSYYLIQQTLNDFDVNSVSMVVESLRPLDEIDFPSIGICELSYFKDTYEELEEIIESLKPYPDADYNSDVESFLTHIIFQDTYSFDSLEKDCEDSIDCGADCSECPMGNYGNYSEIVRATCDELIKECSWLNDPFECCKYFKPIRTSVGKCYLLNSIQLVEKGGPNWLNMKVGFQLGVGLLKLTFLKAVSLYVINEEEIPHLLLTSLRFTFLHEGAFTDIKLNMLNVVNDEGVKDLDPEKRKCRFPDEQYNSLYKYYSYSTCVTECLKRAQIKVCNCTHHNMIYDESDNSPVCDYYGLVCLDRADFIFPQTIVMQPWRPDGLNCDCLPSCNDHEISIVEKTSLLEEVRSTVIALQSISEQRYRRQDVKENLDVVVSIGGILGLFLGASILSGVEFFYFFTVRLIGTAWQSKTKKLSI